MKKWKVLCFLFLLVFQVNAQVTITPVVTDLVVSTTNIPSTYLQSNTQLSIGQDELLYFWQDYRYGEPEYMAQRVALDGTKKGNNLRMGKYGNFCYAPDGSLLAIGARKEDYILTKTGKIFKGDNSSLPEFDILSGMTPWCLTGWLGYHETITATDSHYVYFHSFGGHVSLHKFDFNGNLVYEGKGTSAGLPIGAHDVFTISNNLNEYVLFYPQNNYQHSGLFATFFSPNNTITAANVIIDTTSNISSINNYRNVRAIPINDSMYHVMATSKRRTALFSWLVNKNGNDVIPLPAVALFGSGTILDPLNITIENVNISRMVGNKFVILVTVSEKTGQEKKYYNTLITYDNKGSLLNRLTDTTFHSVKGRFINLNHDNTIFVPSSNNEDASQIKFIGLVATEMIKLNDDLFGGNKLFPLLHKVNGEEVFISYSDENNLLGRRVDSIGNILTDEIKLENTKLFFFSDRWSVSTWTERAATGYYHKIGFSIYDSDFNLKRNVALTDFQDQYQDVEVIIPGDTYFIVGLYKGFDIYLRKYNRNGDMLKEVFVGTTTYKNSVKLRHATESSFLLSAYDYNLFLNFELETVSPIYKPSVINYLGKTYHLTTTYSGGALVGQVFSFNGDSLTAQFYISASTAMEGYVLDRLTDEYFLILFNSNGKIYLKTFSVTGNQIGDSILVHSDVPGLRRLYKLLVNENKLYCVWSEARNPDKGYDVYCSIFELNFLPGLSNKPNTGLVNEFKLQQNYPNPFNPTTNIPFTTDKDGKVEIKIYNTLGEEVAKIFSGELPAGKHKVEFNAGNLPVGIYLCQLRLGLRAQTIKLMLLK
jgi:hypothetical protein